MLDPIYVIQYVFMNGSSITKKNTNLFSITIFINELLQKKSKYFLIKKKMSTTYFLYIFYKENKSFAFTKK